MTQNLDRLDRQLLEALQGNARLTVAELAERVALSQSSCWRRIKQLEEENDALRADLLLWSEKEVK